MLGVLGKAKSQGEPMRQLLALVLPAVMGLASPGLAEDFSLTIKDHRFEPAQMPLTRSSRATISTPRRSSLVAKPR
jgi:hypothetical protein